MHNNRETAFERWESAAFLGRLQSIVAENRGAPDVLILIPISVASATNARMCRGNRMVPFADA
jgi:hypothetical protein